VIPPIQLSRGLMHIIANQTKTIMFQTMTVEVHSYKDFRDDVATNSTQDFHFVKLSPPRVK
jgi:hypothetical protein